MAYIDKDKLYEAITDLPYSEGCAVYDSDDVENTIRNFPEADVQEVVRCRDCENYTQEGNYLPKCSYLSKPVGLNSYCCFGRKKEEHRPATYGESTPIAINTFGGD